MKFGRYDSFEEFMRAYTMAERAAERQARAADVSVEAALARARGRKERDVVEVQALVVDYPDTHQRSRPVKPCGYKKVALQNRTHPPH